MVEYNSIFVVELYLVDMVGVGDVKVMSSAKG